MAPTAVREPTPSSHFDLPSFETGSYEDSTTETTPAEHRARRAHEAARLYKEAKAAKGVAAAAAAAAGGSSGGAAAATSTGKVVAAQVEDASQPEWVKQQSEIKRAVALATANLNDVEGDSTAAVREASFRKAVARINQMTKEYNLNVPMERFQRPVYSEKRIDTLVKQAAN